MTKQIKAGTVILNLKVKSVDAVNVNLSNGQKIPIEFAESLIDCLKSKSLNEQIKEL